MATIGRRKSGSFYVQVEHGGDRITIPLGRCSKSDATEVKLKVQRLANAKRLGGTLETSITEWVATLPDAMHAVLSDHGLVDARRRADATTLRAVCDEFIANNKVSVKPQTKLVWKQAKNHLERIIGADRDIASITPADADDFRERMLKDEYSVAFVAKMVMTSKAILRRAVRRGVLKSSPFADVANGSQRNEERQRYIPAATIDKIIDQTTDLEWKAMIALARFAGLRIPSEPLALTWGDIDFDRGRMTIRSSKTSRHEGKSVRVIPLFPAVEKHLIALHAAAEDGQVNVFTRLRRPNANLRTTFTKLVTRAGQTPWPRLFQNLRASFATDLVSNHPAHVAAAWTGHSETIARKHYWQTTDEDFSRALGRTADDTGQRAAKGAASSRASGILFAHPAHRTQEAVRANRSEKPAASHFSAKTPESAISAKMGDEGFEAVAARKTPRKCPAFSGVGAESGAPFTAARFRSFPKLELRLCASLQTHSTSPRSSAAMEVS